MAPAPCPTSCSTSSRGADAGDPSGDRLPESLHGPLCFPGEPERDDLSLSGRQQRQRAQVRPNGCAVLLQHAQEGDWPVQARVVQALPEKAKEELYQALEDQFVFFYKKLNIDNTKELVNEIVKPVEYHQPMPASAHPRATIWAWPTKRFSQHISQPSPEAEAFGKRINTDVSPAGPVARRRSAGVRFLVRGLAEGRSPRLSVGFCHSDDLGRKNLLCLPHEILRLRLRMTTAQIMLTEHLGFVDEDEHQVVDVGLGGAGEQQVVDGAQVGVSVVPAQSGFGVQAQCFAAATVAASAMPPALSVGPSVPSVASDTTTMPGLSCRAIAADRASSWLRPPMPGSAPRVTVVSPPRMRQAGGCSGAGTPGSAAQAYGDFGDLAGFTL